MARSLSVPAGRPPHLSAGSASRSRTAAGPRSTSPRYDARRHRAARRARARPAPRGVVRARGVDEALVGGFFTRPATEPLGELRTRGIARRHVPFAAPWGRSRACVHVDGGRVRIARARRAARAPRAATCCRPARCWSATARSSTTARGPGGLHRRRPPVRLRHHREPPPARRAGPDGRASCWRSPATAARAPTPA